jgi:hypothetical protein
MSEKSRVVQVRPAGDEHQVVSLRSTDKRYRRKPCGGCPWVKENTGDFPAEAFEHSAQTSEDMSQHVFACHESGSERSSTCAGFLLRGSANNMAVRLRTLRGEIDWDSIQEDERELYDSYREMAVGNGVDPESPALKDVRP